MNRLIKFRVWDSKLLKFNYFDLLSTIGNLPVDCIDNVQQYTGLKDVNGCEIYEGDIVKYDDTRFEQITYYVNGNWGLGMCGEILYPIFDKVETVGNIFENPDLLNSIKEENICCEKCGRIKAKNFTEACNGNCPREYAYRDPDAEKDCIRHAEIVKNAKFRFCENCNKKVNVDLNGGSHENCDFVYGRRGWRQLGAYDG